MKGSQKGRKMISWILVICMVVSLASILPGRTVKAAEEEAAQEDSVFVHPGLLHTAQSIEAIKKNVADGVEPTLSAYHALVGDGFSDAGWGGRPLEDVTRPGNCAQMYIDIERAYQTALLYQLGAGEQYGEAAVRILNGWSHTMKTLTGNADRFLASGIYGYQLANAAELVRDREDFDKEAMDTLLLHVFYPMNHDFLVNHNGTSEGRRIRNYWANWDLCNIAGMLAIGIFCDRTDIYEEAVEYYRNGVGMGSFYNAMPYVYDVGLAQWQESGRDQGHATLGISLCGAINEMAWSQGENLYGLSDNRFLKAAEYVAKYNNGDDDVPYSYYERFNSANGKVEGNPGISDAARGSRRPVFTAIYNHYVNRMGLEAPELEKVLYPDGTTPFTEGGTRVGDEPGWQSLTFHNISTGEEAERAKEMNGNLEDGIYRICNRNSKKCLVDRDGLLQSAAKGTMDEEWWEVKNTGDGEYIVTNVVTGRVIQTAADVYTSDAAAYIAGTRYVLGDTVTGEMNQRLAFLKVTGDYIYRIVSGSCSHVLECFNAKTEDDAELGQWWYEGGTNQQWYVEQKEPSRRKIAGFHLDDETSGLTGAGAIASASDTLSFVKDEERGMVLFLSGSECLAVTKEDKSALLSGCTELTVSYYSKSGGSGESIPFYAAASPDADSYIGITEQGGRVTAVHKENGTGDFAEGSLKKGWNHVVAVFQADRLKLYVNGVLQSDTEIQGSLDTVLGADSILQIGQNFNGYLDDVTIYNYAMSESSIKEMEGQRLVAEFTFDDEVDGFVSGNARADSAGTIVLSEDAKEGKAFSMDGSGSNYLRLVNGQGEPLASGWEEMTVSYWSKVTSDGTNWMFYAAPNDETQVYGSEVYLGAFENGGFVLVERYKNTGTRISNISEAAEKNVWKHIVVSFGRDTTTVYVNGKRKAALQSYYSVSDILGEESVFYLGKANWGDQGEYCNALLDKVRIYNFALDDTAAQKDFEGYPAAQIIREESEDHSADEAAARLVMDKISAIGTVSYNVDCKEKIENAREAYDALTEVQKEIVDETVYAVLLTAEAEYASLVKQAEADQKAAEAAAAVIRAIGTVVYDAASKERIDLARKTYTVLSESQKHMIDEQTYALLTAAEAEYQRLAAYEKEEREKAEQEKAEQEKAAQEQAAKEKAQQGTVAAEESQKEITKTNTDKGDPKGSTFAAMKVKAAGGNKSVTLTWSKVKSADGYLVYGASCGKPLKLLKDVSSSKKSYKQTKLKKGTYYKYIVSAYRNIYGEKRVIATSVSVHACTNGGKYTNPSSISYSRTKITLKKGKTFTLKPKLKTKKTVITHIAKFRYESSNPNVATVSKKGKIKGKSKGTCYIYLYTQNGIYKRVKVTVK